MQLSAFMISENLSDEDFAAKLGCTPFAVRKWKYGERVPRRNAMVRISEVTGGKVTANDFMPASPEAAA